MVRAMARSERLALRERAAILQGIGEEASISRACRLLLRLSLRDHDDNGDKRLISKTKALHMRYTFWYISLPSPAKHEREMNKFKLSIVIDTLWK